jgi:glucose/arabinose dehydrogenase
LRPDLIFRKPNNGAGNLLMKRVFVALAGIIGIALIGGAGLLSLSGESATLDVDSGYGQTPVLVNPNPTLLPTVNIAESSTWPVGVKPKAAAGLRVEEFAGGLDHPRWLHVLPNGDVLVAETNAPQMHDQGSGIKGWMMKYFMSRAGAGVPSANRITLLRDLDGDGVADSHLTFLSGLNSPFGMATIAGRFYVANTDAILGFDYVEGAASLVGEGEHIIDLPAGPINHHWTKDVIASRDGSKLYVTVGSNGNVGENGMEVEKDRAAVLQVDIKQKAKRIFASGLRNPNGLSWNPQTGGLWVAVNERDEIGSDLVPDYMTEVLDGAFYGWPYSYYGQHVDVRVAPQRPDLVAQAVVPDFALGAHTGSLGLTFNSGIKLGAIYQNGAFVGQHGSWNRKPRSGYKVIFVPFAGGKPSGLHQDVLSGFVSEDGKAMGRPVGVAIDKSGALLVADDVGNKIWRVTSNKGNASAH